MKEGALESLQSKHPASDKDVGPRRGAQIEIAGWVRCQVSKAWIAFPPSVHRELQSSRFPSAKQRLSNISSCFEENIFSSSLLCFGNVSSTSRASSALQHIQYTQMDGVQHFQGQKWLCQDLQRRTEALPIHSTQAGVVRSCSTIRSRAKSTTRERRKVRVRCRMSSLPTVSAWPGLVVSSDACTCGRLCGGDEVCGDETAHQGSGTKGRREGVGRKGLEAGKPTDLLRLGSFWVQPGPQ